MSMLKNIIAIVCTTAIFSLISFAEVSRVSGILEPLQDADISASVAGKIDAIHFREGEAVDKGTVVIQLKNALERYHRHWPCIGDGIQGVSCLVRRWQRVRRVDEPKFLEAVCRASIQIGIFPPICNRFNHHTKLPVGALSL